MLLSHHKYGCAQKQLDFTSMSTDTHSQTANVASDRHHETPIASEQSNAQTTPGTKDTETLFREAFEEAVKMTCEERWERCPVLSE